MYSSFKLGFTSKYKITKKMTIGIEECGFEKN